MENYKGLLQQTCHIQMLGVPSYDTQRHGTDNEPTWIVQITLSDRTYKTEAAIAGRKRTAEQKAAKQLLTIMASEQNTALEDDALEDDSDDHYTDLKPTQIELDCETIDVPIELVNTALGMANHRLAELQRSRRIRAPLYLDDREFCKRLASLTVTIVRQIANDAQKLGITFDNNLIDESVVEDVCDDKKK